MISENTMAKRRKSRKTAKTLISIFIVLVLAIISYFTEPWQYIGGEKNEIGNKNEADLQVHYIDVGQADSILVRVPTSDGVKNMLIDAGTSDGYPASNIVNYLNGLGITELEYMIITHPHLDHIGRGRGDHGLRDPKHHHARM